MSAAGPGSGTRTGPEQAGPGPDHRSTSWSLMKLILDQQFWFWPRGGGGSCPEEGLLKDIITDQGGSTRTQGPPAGPPQTGDTPESGPGLSWSKTKTH